ncbi:hypothetical protein [Brevibacillus sp. H7]|uniref:hypothetical protein n=1 Tax=Brevibacillus sp. H7 TaxID=3349138 RepID=UPI0037FC5BCF
MMKPLSIPMFRAVFITAACTQLLLHSAGQIQSKEVFPVNTPTHPVAMTKATWLWDTGKIATEPEEVLSFLRQNDMNLLYLQVKQDQISQTDYRSFLRLAHENGVEVHALDGRPEWALLEHYPKLQSFVDWVHQYNRSVEEHERFSGIHLDIEPYLLPQWKRHRNDVVHEWMEVTSRIVPYIKTSVGLTAGADLPFWLDIIPGEKFSTPLSTWMINEFDHVTVMAYRNKATDTDGIVTHVKQELEAASARNKKVIVAVNIRQTNESEKVSFAKKGKAEMQRQLDIADTHLRPYPSYAGQAIHDYESWKHALD